MNNKLSNTFTGIVVLIIFFSAACKKNTTGTGNNNPSSTGKPTFSWIKKFKNVGAYGVITDASDNVYLSGVVFGTPADLGGGALNSKSFFIAKYTADGNFIWQKHFTPLPGFSAGGTIQDLAIDGEGNVIGAGTLSQATSFNGTTNDTAKFGTHPFILKLNKDGNYIWHKIYKLSFNSIAEDVAVDPSGNIFISGQFGGVLNGKASKGTIDAFILGVDKNGNNLWTKTFGRINDNNDDYAPAMQRGKDGQLYVTRSFKDNLAGDITLTATGSNYNTYYFKCDASGNVGLQKGLGSASGAVNTLGITANSSGNIFLAGSFAEIVDFGDGAVTVPDPLIINPFLLQASPAGGFASKKIFTATTFSENNQITWRNDELITTGFTASTNNGTVINLGNGNIDATSPKVYWAAYDQSGNYLWHILFKAFQSGSSCKDITVDSKGHIYAVGDFVEDGASNSGVDYVLVKY